MVALLRHMLPDHAPPRSPGVDSLNAGAYRGRRRFFLPVARYPRWCHAHRARTQTGLQGRLDPSQALDADVAFERRHLARQFAFRHGKDAYDGIPIIAANMDSTGTFDMARALAAPRAVGRPAQAL
jgi:hypothetical protein